LDRLKAFDFITHSASVMAVDVMAVVAWEKKNPPRPTTTVWISKPPQ